MPQRNRPNRLGQNANPLTGGGGGSTGGVNIFTGGGGGGQNRPRNRGSGGGGNRVPKGGLYPPGRAGAAAANMDPEAFFRKVLTKNGILSGQGDEADLYGSGAFIDQMLRDYEVASADDQRLDATEWLQNTYGAGWQGKRGKNYQAGTLTADNPVFAQGAATNYSNTNPLAYLTTQGLGGPLAQGGNDEFAQFYNSRFAPRLEAEYTHAKAANPGLNISDWYAQQGDLNNRAQTEYQGWRSNQDPISWVAQQGVQRGQTASNGNQQYNDFYNTIYADTLNARFNAARASNPNLNFNDFMATQDPNEARRLFAHRAPQFRQPSPYQPAGGRWSWWS